MGLTTTEIVTTALPKNNKLALLFLMILLCVTSLGECNKHISNEVGDDDDVSGSGFENSGESEDILFMSPKQKAEVKESKFKCIGLNPKIKTDLKKYAKLGNAEKLELFKKGPCAPVILIPGYFGSKLEFIMKSCKTFKKFHANIMKSCGWDDCTHKALKRFVVFVNFDIDMSLIFGGMNKGKKKDTEPYLPKIFKYIKVDKDVINIPYRDECLGNLLRLYYKKSKEQGSDKDVYKIVDLQGAEIKPLNPDPNACGISAARNFLGDTMTKDRSYQGFHELIRTFQYLGYENGLSMLIAPYDFRRSINEIIPMVEKAIKLAYKLTKKKPVVIGHSYGGIIAYKASLGQYSDLIAKAISIGSPFLGSPKAFLPYLKPLTELNQKKEFSIFGIKIEVATEVDPGSLEQIIASFASPYNYFPKDIKHDQVDSILQEISRIEKEIKQMSIELSSKEGLTLSAKKKAISDQFDKLVTEAKYKDIISYFYTIFPKASDSCTSVLTSKLKIWNDQCKLNFENVKENVLSIDNSTFKYNDVREIKEVLKNHSYLNFLPLLNDKVHDLFKIDDGIFDFLFDNADKEIFEYKPSKAPFMFIFSSSVATDNKIFLDSKSKKVTQTTQSLGDGTIGSTSQFYNGLRWILQDKMEGTERNIPTHFVEYCAKHEIYNRKSYNKNKTQYIGIGCDCINHKNLNKDNDCNHASILNDTKLNLLIKDIVTDNWAPVQIDNYNELYQTQYRAFHQCEHLQ